MEREKIQSFLEKYIVTQVVNCRNGNFMHIGSMYLSGIKLYVLRIFSGQYSYQDEIFVGKNNLYQRFYSDCEHINCHKGSLIESADNIPSYFAEIRYTVTTIEKIDYEWIKKGELLLSEDKKVYFIEQRNKEWEYYDIEEKVMEAFHKKHRVLWDNRIRWWTKLGNAIGAGGSVFLQILLILLFLGMLGGAIFGIYYAINSAINAPHTKGSRNGLIIFGMMASTMAMGWFIIKSRGDD